MKFWLISALFFISLFFGAGTTAIAQPPLTDQPCEISDPLSEDEPDSDPCCGIVYSAKVCYYVGDLAAPNSNYYYIFQQLDHPCGQYIGQESIFSFDELADSMTANCPQNVFTYYPATGMICADSVSPSYGNLVLLYGCFNCIVIDTIVKTPLITPYPCPIQEPGQAFIDALLNPNGATIADNVVFNGFAGTATTHDVLNPDSTISDPNYTGPSGNSIGIILNAMIESGAWKYGAGCFNLNCLDLASMADGLNQDTIAGEINNYFDTLPSPPNPGGQSYSSYFSHQVANVLAGINLPELLNANLGFSIPNIPCDSTLFSFEGIYGNNGSGPQPAGPPTGTPETGAEQDYFSQTIPGLGQDAAPPSPSSMEMIKNVKGGVSLYNGSQSTSIPLYNFQAHDISIPLSVSSSDNGLKVNDLGSLVGQHWNLDVAGEITRIIKGLPDEFYGTVEGIGRGRNFKLSPRFEFPSNIGLRLTFPGDKKLCQLYPGQLDKLKDKIKNGFKFNTPYEVGKIEVDGVESPVTFQISWSPLKPNLVNFTIGIPVFNFFGITVYLEIGCSAGISLNEALGKVPYKETGLGYLNLDDASKMIDFGLPAINPSLIQPQQPAIQELLLEKMQSAKRFDDVKFFSDHIANWDNWIQTIKNIFTEGFAVKTKKLDTEPDEFHYNCGGYSGSFSFTIQGDPVLFPYYEGVQVEPGYDGTTGDLISFTITTPEGMVYSFGKSTGTSDPDHGVDWTQNTNYYLPNFYTYPEVGENNTHFDKAQIDMAVMYYQPFLGPRRVRTWGNTYDRNYKVMDSPRYSSTWHLISVKSLMTEEEVTLEYERRDLNYYSDKSYSHSFPNFDVKSGLDTGGGGIGAPFFTTANGNLNTLSLFTNTKWESGRAEFSYSATETNLLRWHLVKINGNRGENVQFYYDNGTPRGEIVNDYLLDKILVKRSGLTFKGWKFGYDILSAGSPSEADCSPGIPGFPAPPPISMTGEIVFNLGNAYTIKWHEYHSYLFFTLGIGKCFTLPFQIPFPFTPVKRDYGYRQKMSEFGSLMEIKSFVGEYNEAKESAIYNAEKKRSFLKTIQEIDRNESLHPFITNIGYIAGILPKKFSFDQDLFGYYNDNSESGSPLPKMLYKSISGAPVVASAVSANHYGFFNEAVPGGMRFGHKETADENRAKIGALQSVEFASGAKISYEYQLNDLPNGTKGAGLRVKQLTEDPHDSPAKVTLYGYQNPTVVNDPIRIYQNFDDYYYRGLEGRVATTSSPQNYLFPNKNNHVGYGIVTDTFVGNGWIDHYFTNPFTGYAFLDSIFQTTPTNNAFPWRFHLNKKGYLCCSSFSSTNAVQVPPQLEFPVFSYQSWLMGVEHSNTMYAASGGIRQKNNYEFSLYRSGNLLYSPSVMYQNNYPGSFWENYAYRLVQNFQPFNGGLINDLVDFLVDIILGNVVPHPFKEIDRYYYASDRRLSTANIRPVKSVTEDYLFGGVDTVVTDYAYIGDQNARVISSTTTYTTSESGFSQQTITDYLYASDNAAEINDFGAKNHLNTFGYNQPLVSKTSLDGTLIKEDYTSLKMHSGTVVPDRNFTLREGVLIPEGIFDSHDGNGMPTSYTKIQFDGNSFPQPMFFTWNNRLQLTSKSYAGFTATKTYGPTYFELQSVQDVNGVGTQFTYDLRWRLATQMALNDRQFTTYAYTIAPGNNTIVSNLSFTDGSAPAQPSTLKLDGFGRELFLRRDNDGALLTAKAYDNYYRLAGESYIKTGPVTYVYEGCPLPRWTTETDGAGNTVKTETHVSDVFYVNTQVTDPNSHLSQTHLDAIGLTQRTISGEGSTTNYGYDNFTRLTSIINPISEPYIFTYNAMDKVATKKVPGAASEQIFGYDQRYRMISSQDPNGNTFDYSYDELDRILEVNSSDGLLLRNVWQGGGNWIDLSDERIFTEQGPGEFKTTDNTLDDIGRVEQAAITYPAGNIHTINTLNNALQLTDAITEINGPEYVALTYHFSYDDVLRPVETGLSCNGEEDVLSHLEYNGMDLVSAKFLGSTASPGEYLQEVNYFYDGAGKLIQINGQEDLECDGNVGEEICSLIANFNNDPRNGACPLYLSSVEVNGQHYPVDPGLELYDPNNSQYLGPIIEAALAYFGFYGTVTVNSYEQNGYIYYDVTIYNTNASEVVLWSPECPFAEFVPGDCCETGGEEIMAGITLPAASDDLDLYFEKITYTGWDITNIKYGGDCTWGIMSNDFTYDANHQVTAMNSGVFNPHATNANYSTTYQYDLAGNIQRLTRNGLIELLPGGNSTYGQIDNLRYNYAGERLKGVEDLVSNAQAQPKGFKPLISNYEYDPNGNIISDEGKGLTIEINPINLPRRVVKSGIGGGEIKLHYTFGGEKLKQEVTGADSETRLYMGGVEFVDDGNGMRPEAYYHGEGRVLLKDGQRRFQYKITDHLGDLAVFFEDKNNDGDIETEEETSDPNTLEILQRHFYYPFGLNMEGPWAMQDQTVNQYQYNGKELEEDLGLDWYFYGARMYDAAIGRFTGVDPIAEKFPHVSTFNYAENSPVRYIDLHGLQAAEFAMDRDVKELTSGKITKEQYYERMQARFVGGVMGIVGAGIGTAAITGGGSLLSWSFSNPVAAMELVGTAGTFGVGVLDEGNQIQIPWTAADDFGRFTRYSFGVYEKAFGEAIVNAGSNLIYIGTKEGLPYIGKTTTAITSRYKKIKEAPTPFTDFFNAPSDHLYSIENALIKLNGGPKSGKISNQQWSRTEEGTLEESIKKGEKWLTDNISDWRTRFKFD